jgi:phosphoribosyl-ATP pyrophosphohydrolase/phosphoribosyl-AMP cyclohydrolase
MNVKFREADGLVPVIVQDAYSERVLMLEYMNEEAYQQTQNSHTLILFNAISKQTYKYGDEQNSALEVKELKQSCTGEALLAKVKCNEPLCKEAETTCFGEQNDHRLYFMGYLQDLIEKRKQEMPEKSYTTKLFKKGINKIAQKLGEEAVELVIEAKDEDNDLLLNEAADLMYHMLVLLSQKGQRFEDVAGILKERHK